MATQKKGVLLQSRVHMTGAYPHIVPQHLEVVPLNARDGDLLPILQRDDHVPPQTENSSDSIAILDLAA